jgi:hypothetical protein
MLRETGLRRDARKAVRDDKLALKQVGERPSVSDEARPTLQLMSNGRGPERERKNFRASLSQEDVDMQQ